MKTTLGLLCILALSACAMNPNPDRAGRERILPGSQMYSVRAESLNLIRRLLDEELVPGLSLVLVDAEGLLWMEAFGVSNTDNEEPVRIDSVFRAGSLSKPLTAMAVLQLFQGGFEELERPLEHQLKGFSVKRHLFQSGPITVKQLLAHHSGLPSDIMKGMFTDTPFAQVGRELNRTYLSSAPGTRYNYSNLGYDLLGLVIEERSEIPYADYMRTRLLEPLQMEHSGYFLTPEMERRLVTGHLDGNSYPLPPLRDTPALGYYTSAQDMGKLLNALLKSRMPGLSPASLELMWRDQPDFRLDNSSGSMGLGWYIEDYPEIGRLVRHGGSTLLFGAEMALLPDAGLGVAVLANGAHSNHLTRELAATILSLAVRAKGYRLSGPSQEPSVAQGRELNGASGSYATSLGLLMVESKSQKLCACIIERILDLTRFDDGSFALTPESAENLPESYRILGELRFNTRQRDGEEILVAYRNGQELVLGNKIDQAAMNDVWRQRLGAYETINPDGDFTLENLRLSDEEGVICLHYEAPHLSDREIRLPLVPISDRQAVVQGLGRGAGETLEIVEIDGRACLRFSGYIGMPTEKK